MMCLSLLLAQMQVQPVKASAGMGGNAGAILGGVALVAVAVVLVEGSIKKFSKPDSSTVDKIVSVVGGVVGAVIGFLGTITLDAEDEKNINLELTEITLADGLKLGLSPDQARDLVDSYNQELDEIKLAVNAAELELKNISMTTENKDQISAVLNSKFENISPDALVVFKAITQQFL